MKALVLAALVAVDGGVPDAGLFDAPLYATCPTAPPVEPLDGGWVLFPPARAERVACLMAACEKDRQLKQEALVASPPPLWWVVATTAVVAAAAAAFAVGRATAPSSAPPAPAP